MKFTTFRNTLLSVGALTALGSIGYVATNRAPPAPPPPRPPAQLAPTTNRPEQVSPPPVVSPPPPAATEGTALRDVDRVMLALLKGPARDKVKDATPGKPFKVNLYSDDGKRFNRAKVDLDRDEKWDEKWSVDAQGAIERGVAPNDDEKYVETYALRNDLWARQ